MFDKKTLTELQAAFKDWETEYGDQFKKERKAVEEFVCDSGIPVKRLYTPLDLKEKGIEYAKDIGLPGEYPYTRGTVPNGYRKELWHIGQYGGHATPEQSNILYRKAVDAGASMISMAYDLPTQLGLDPDNPRAEGEVGRVGISSVSLRDWEIAFSGIELGKYCIQQVANAMAAPAIANHICMAEEQGVSKQQMVGRCQNDILKEYLVRGNYIFPPKPSLRLTTDVLAYCCGNLPHFDAMTICSMHYSESQCTPVHDTAFALADGFCYLQAAVDQGLDIDSIAPTMELGIGHEHYGFFQEIAKMRAARRIWARVLRDRFKARKPESLACRMICAQGGNSLQRRQYLNNIGRTAISIVVAALGGARAIDLRTYDEQFGIPSAEAVVQNIRLQHVVAQETGITDTVDPLGGSYFIESLTSEFEERIVKEIDEIEKRGGVVECIENGYMKKIIVQDAYKWQRDFEAGKVIRVGANFFTSKDEERPVTIYRTDPKIEKQRVEAVQELRKRRDNPKVKKALGEIKAMAILPGTAKNNMMPPIIEAMKNYATIGEVCDTLRGVWGECPERWSF